MVALDIVPKKVGMLNCRQSPIEDAELDKLHACVGPDCVIISTQTYPETTYFITLCIVR